MKGVDSRLYEMAEWWFGATRSERGYTKEEVQELAEAFQQAAEDAVMDDEDDAAEARS